MDRKSFLETLAERPIVGDGSYVMTLEKRGYVKGGPWTPEAVVESPEAVRQLHYDFLRAGADALQAFSFYATDGKLAKCESTCKSYKSEELNQAACDLVREVADTRPGTFVCGGISPTPSYPAGAGKEAIQVEFRKQMRVFVDNQVDFVLAEFFGHIEEAEWAVVTLKESGLPVACTMRIGPTGDIKDVTPGECAVRLARAGADVVGVNCQYDPTTCIETIRMMKAGLDEAGLKPFLMLQPVGFHCPDCVQAKDGYHDLPEFPFALEPRLLTRWDVRRYAREAYDAGVRYLGGCCGFEPYHIREISEELANERGFCGEASKKTTPWGQGLVEGMTPKIRARTTREYWENLKPASGRPDCPKLSTPQ